VRLWDLRMSESEQDDNYYTVLGVPRGADTGVIRNKYRRLMQHAGNHPDLGGDTRKAAMINKAYAVLCDAELRREHDSRLDVLDLVATGINLMPEPVALDPARDCLFCERPHEYGEHDLEDLSCGTCGSALKAVEDLRIDPSGKRSVQRLGRSMDVTLYTHWRQKKGFAASTEDISPLGVRLTTRLGLQSGQRVRLACSLFDAVGEVSHCAPGRIGWREVTIAGVIFRTLRFSNQTGTFVSRQV